MNFFSSQRFTDYLVVKDEFLTMEKASRKLIFGDIPIIKEYF